MTIIMDGPGVVKSRMSKLDNRNYCISIGVQPVRLNCLPKQRGHKIWCV